MTTFYILDNGPSKKFNKKKHKAPEDTYEDILDTTLKWAGTSSESALCTCLFPIKTALCMDICQHDFQQTNCGSKPSICTASG